MRHAKGFLITLLIGLGLAATGWAGSRVCYDEYYDYGYYRPAPRPRLSVRFAYGRGYPAYGYRPVYIRGAYYAGPPAYYGPYYDSYYVRPYPVYYGGRPVCRHHHRHHRHCR